MSDKICHGATITELGNDIKRRLVHKTHQQTRHKRVFTVSMNFRKIRQYLSLSQGGFRLLQSNKLRLVHDFDGYMAAVLWILPTRTTCPAGAQSRSSPRWQRLIIPFVSIFDNCVYHPTVATLPNCRADVKISNRPLVGHAACRLYVSVVSLALGMTRPCMQKCGSFDDEAKCGIPENEVTVLAT